MEAFETFSNEVAIKILSVLGLSSIVDLHQNGELPPQYRLKIVHYPQSLNGSNQGCGVHTDHAEWLTIIDKYGEATLEVENEMALVLFKPSHLSIVPASFSKRHAIKSV
jgi:hypothetical protein